jgi:phosphoribosyl 1,2-cyclic phosphodiesterase
VRVRFWGTRGSLPVAMTSAQLRGRLVSLLTRAMGEKLETPQAIEAFVDREYPESTTFGGNSSCVEVETGGPDYVLCDLGSGVRAFGNHVVATRGPSGHTFHVFMSHVHWDHIMGFPFFVPAYVPGNTIRIYGCHPTLEEALRRQHAAPSFPVEYSQLGARIEVVPLAVDRTYEIAGLRVRAILQDHGGDSYGYRFERDDKVLVYSTDSEHKLDDLAFTDRFVAFFRDADLVIFDAMYSLADAFSVKEDWGHSSNVVGVELCQRARAKHLCLFHHEPVHDDAHLRKVLQETRRFEEITRGDVPLAVSAAYDGMEIVL